MTEIMDQMTEYLSLKSALQRTGKLKLNFRENRLLAASLNWELYGFTIYGL